MKCKHEDCLVNRLGDCTVGKCLNLKYAGIPEPAPDTVSHPSHYTQAGIECIKAIEAITADKQGFEAYCIGNITKYLWRYAQKNGIEDIKKARQYMDFLIDYLEGKAE